LYEGLRSLDLSSNNIHNVTIIPEVKTLEKIDLSNNGITNINYDAFDNLDYVDVLILSNNSIETITEDIFEWNPLQLKVLHLDGNKMEFIQHFLLYDLDQLMELDVSRNRISFIHPHAFGQQKKLLRLNLSGNQLHTIKHQWFKSFSGAFLENINLQDNPFSCDCAMHDTVDWIKKKEQNWLKRFVKDQLICAKPEAEKGKHIIGKEVKVPTMDGHCDQPMIVGISVDTTVGLGANIQLSCKATGIPVPTIDWRSPQNDIYNVHNADHYEGIRAHSDGSLIIMGLAEDDFGNYTCIATSKGGSVEQVTQLMQDHTADPVEENTKEVEKAKNETVSEDDQNVVVQFDPNSSDCFANCSCRSRRADCSSQGLSIIPDKIPQDTITYNLAGNRITKIGQIGNYSKLVELSLDDNLISDIDPKAFKYLSQLQTLTLRNNKITKIKTHTFQNLKKLTILVLDHNNIESIASSYFKPFSNLQWLYIRNNNIKQINQDSFSRLDNVKFIHMENNMLPNINLHVIKPLIEKDDVTITRIFVDNNPFNCDCNMDELHQYLHASDSKASKTLFGDGIRCRYPAEYSGQSLSEIPPSTELLCGNATNGAVAQPPTDTSVSNAALTAMWFGGCILGILLCIGTILLSKRYGRRICGRSGGSARYSSIAGADQSDYASLTANSGGSEAFI
jgi:Leucine-rich repeat (LRR) protein